MKVLVIPDVHLKSWIFHSADMIMEKYNYDRIVVLGDIVDSHGDIGNSLDAYAQTLEAAVEFATKYSTKLTWLWGNHEIAYIEPYCMCRPHNYEAEPMVTDYFRKILDALKEDIKIVERIDSVIFSHAGITGIRASRYFKPDKDISYTWDAIVEGFNRTRYRELWEPRSPIWYRPDEMVPPYTDGACLQVVGHNPTGKPCLFHNMLFTDTFHEGCANVFPVIDTVTHEVAWLGRDGEIKGYGFVPELS